jgi:hypothetical protein
VDPYLEFWRQAATVGRGNLAMATLFFDAQALRTMWVAHLTQATDRFLRSPEFLELMRLGFQSAGNSRSPGPLP